MKTFIVTGAGSGLGKELAVRLANQGFHILLIGRTMEKLRQSKVEIELAGGHAAAIAWDIRNLADISEQLRQIHQQHPVFGLVNNAGVGHFGGLESLTEEQIREMIDTNVIGTIAMTKAVLPFMLSNMEGHVLNIISTAGLRPKVNETVYVASKFAIRGFTESLQKEYEGSNIQFTAVYMGGMNTPFWDHSEHVKDPSRFRTAGEVADRIMEQMNEASILIESKKS